MTNTAFIAIVGKPNVGKSSLLNRIVGQKIAIVSYRPQTTRTRITGVYTKDETQLVFLDTPGLFEAKNCLGNKMVKTVHQSVSDVDAAVLMVEPEGKVKEAERSLIESFRARKLPAILVINKIDLLQDKKSLMKRIAQYAPLYDFAAIVPISVLRDDGVDRLLGELKQFTYQSVHYFPEDAVTDQPERLIAAEILREKILKNMRDEIPHGIAVVTERFEERKNSVHLEMTIYCERANHKGMIIGKNGEMLKRIGTQARKDLEYFFKTKVDLRCWVKVKEDWRNRENLLHDFGLDQKQ